MEILKKESMYKSKIIKLLLKTNNCYTSNGEHFSVTNYRFILNCHNEFYVISISEEKGRLNNKYFNAKISPIDNIDEYINKCSGYNIKTPIKKEIIVKDQDIYGTNHTILINKGFLYDSTTERMLTIDTDNFT